MEWEESLKGVKVRQRRSEKIIGRVATVLSAHIILPELSRLWRWERFNMTEGWRSNDGKRLESEYYYIIIILINSPNCSLSWFFRWSRWGNVLSGGERDRLHRAPPGGLPGATQRQAPRAAPSLWHRPRRHRSGGPQGAQQLRQRQVRTLPQWKRR